VPRSIIKDIRILSTVIILLSAFLIGGTSIFIDYTRLTEESRLIQNRLLSERKAQLEERVHRAAEYIQYFQGSAENHLKTTIKARTLEACEIAAGLVNRYRGKLEPEALRHIVRDSLRNIRYNDGRGYFFAININGIEELFADKPHLEGKDLTGTQDSNGQFVVQDMLEIASESGEGFYQYTWTKPGNDRNDNIKIAFVKHLPELNWVIGTGEYLEDVEQDMQQEVLNSLDAVYTDPDGENYLFISTWDGMVLSGPATGKNMLEIQDANGLYIVKELIKTAKSGGGFVEYVMPKLEDKRPAPKLSYVAGIPDWRWYIGSGEYIDNIEKSIIELREGFYKELKLHIFYILTITMVALLLNLIITNIFAAKLKKQIQRFMDFFQHAADNPLTINTTTLPHEEFRTIGSAANTMLETRNKAKEELAKHQDQLEQLVEERTSELKKAHADLIQSERLATLGRLTATVSHELRNPLGTIQSAMDTIDQGVELNEPQLVGRAVDLAAKNIKRCVNIIDDLNDYTRVKKLNLSETNIDEWLGTVCDEQILPEEINCERDLNSQATALIDQDKLQQAIINLITNAVHALMDEQSTGKQLLVATRLLDGHYEIIVSDDGVGMPDETRQKIFEPLYSTKGFGVGLGMVITKSIIDQHHGEITIESTEGKGATVTLKLPLQPS
jgi:signal transduction histidine kinase